MAITSTMGQSARNSNIANKVWWAIAIVAAILIVMALIGRRNADAPVTGQSTLQGTVGESTTTNMQNSSFPGTPVVPNTPATTVPNQ